MEFSFTEMKRSMTGEGGLVCLFVCLGCGGGWEEGFRSKKGEGAEETDVYLER